ncbi:MAG: hypothetical protein LAT67_05085 [Balneolales bacterium]|nr:hypothetical protein [Balneolales bacterium]
MCTCKNKNSEWIPLYEENATDSGFLADALYANVFGSIRILEVQGTNPYTLLIELQTNRFFAVGPCKDASIIVRDLNGNALATTTIRTSTFSGCRGSGRLVFSPGFNPTDLVTIQILGGTNPDALERWWDESYMSQPIQFAQSDAIISKPYEQPGFLEGFSVAGISKLTGNTVMLAGLGAALYFAWPFLPILNKVTKDSASKLETYLETKDDE